MAFPDLYVLRHGQTEWNATGRMQGHMDSPLTVAGREQARAMGSILRSLDLSPETTFHCSPLGRTRETADLALAGLTEGLVFDDRLKEISVGAFEGLTAVDLEHQHPDIYLADDRLPWHYRAPGGERYDAFKSRIQNWLVEQTAPAVVVTHGMTSRVLRALALDLVTDGTENLPGGQGIIYRISGGVQTVLEP